MKNSMGKILIYSDKKDLLSKSSKIPIPKTFPMSVAWNIWGISLEQFLHCSRTRSNGSG